MSSDNLDRIMKDMLRTLDEICKEYVFLSLYKNWELLDLE
ncbi:hypothetical protein LCGC14_1366290 [marine sediment metagenome]|uniref:Uncharacterized protein n=1 Tax=marine sediment metagenome TaxID=412755 RepID=A0A0F9MLX5_9ZZZZ